MITARNVACDRDGGQRRCGGCTAKNYARLLMLRVVRRTSQLMRAAMMIGFYGIGVCMCVAGVVEAVIYI